MDELMMTKLNLKLSKKCKEILHFIQIWQNMYGNYYGKSTMVDKKNIYNYSFGEIYWKICIKPL